MHRGVESAVGNQKRIGRTGRRVLEGRFPTDAVRTDGRYPTDILAVPPDTGVGRERRGHRGAATKPTGARPPLTTKRIAAPLREHPEIACEWTREDCHEYGVAPLR